MTASAAPHRLTGTLTLSVVSHGHDDCLRTLLTQLAQAHDGTLREVIVTHNLPAPGVLAPAEGWPFLLTERHNTAPAGFGANHNQALAHCTTPFLAVLNPDVEDLPPRLWHDLVQAASEGNVGCAYPVLQNLDGTAQDSEREVPTPWALLLRYTCRRPPPRRDWVSAACWVVRTEAWQALGGFDEGYFLYCEDVDFCLRLQLQGWSLARVNLRVTHHAQRSSHRRLRYLLLHLRSLGRLWCTPVMYRYWQRLRHMPPAQP